MYAIDLVFDAQALVANMQQLASWAQQLQQMSAQLTQQTNTFQSMTGNRGMGAVLPLANAARNYLPQGASDMVGVLNNTSNSYSGMGNQIQALVSNNSILSNASLTNMNMTTGANTTVDRSPHQCRRDSVHIRTGDGKRQCAV